MKTDIEGILVVDKDKGMTSHDVVNFVRGRFKIKKVGHAGTLDPNATGVLVLLLGKATKLSNNFLNEDKEYVAIMKLGEKTSSGDREGSLVREKDVNVSEQDITETVAAFHGEQNQTPPMVSAKKVNGKRLYKLARKGIEVERNPVKINIKEIAVTNINIPFVGFRVACGKGTYVRQLADDIGEKLGCGAHLTELRRTRSGAFSVDRAITCGDLKNMERETLNENIIRI